MTYHKHYITRRYISRRDGLRVSKNVLFAFPDGGVLVFIRTLERVPRKEERYQVYSNFTRYFATDDLYEAVLAFAKCARAHLRESQAYRAGGLNPSDPARAAEPPRRA